MDQQNDHKSEADALILNQLKTSTALKAFIASFMTQVQELENTFFDLLLQRAIATAEGAQLDALGTIVGVERGGLTDSAYRDRLLTGVLVNTSSGTYSEIAAIIGQLTASDFELREGVQAEFQLELVTNAGDVAETTTLANFVRRIRAAGVYAYVISANSDVTPGGSEQFFSFGPANDLTGDAFGFDNGSFVNAILA
jgi:hypothetical protein